MTVLRRSVARCTAPTAFGVARNGRLTPIAAATTSSDSSASSSPEQRAAEDKAAWQEGAFPSYLQSEVDDFCASWSDALQKHDAAGNPVSSVTKDNPVWQAIRREAKNEAAQEPLLSSFYHASILSHDSFARSLAFVLANRLADATLLATELFEIFHQVLREGEDIKQAALLDIVAFYERDPACITYSAALLYFKGYHAIQTHRIANVLWHRGRKVMAMALQARVSEVLAIDLHPGATLGKGLLLDHGTGVVIGETSRVGDNVSIMQNVTLGGTGKNVGNRHPKVEDNVLIGAGATVLGNITIGKGAQVAAGSLVLRDVEPKTMVAGSPARHIGKVTGNAALRMQQLIQLAPQDQAPQPATPPAPQQFLSNGAVPGGGAPAAANNAASSSGSGSGGSPAVGGPAPSGSEGSNAAAAAASGDASCMDGTLETRDTGSLADWVVSVASKPRRSDGASGSGGGGGGSAGPTASLQQRSQPAAAGAAWSGTSAARPREQQRQQLAGGRGGVVATLAVAAPLAEAAAESAELQLAPTDCEPDWMLTSQLPSLAAWTLQSAAQRRGSGGGDSRSAAERGAAMWKSLHAGDSEGAAAAHAAAVRRHNNRVLAEAGILTGTPGWTVSATAAAEPAPEAAAAETPAAEAQPASQQLAAPAVAEEALEALADYII